MVVLDDEQVIEVVCGSEGVLSSDLAPGAVVSIHSTVELATIARLETAAADAGVRLVDAPISAVHGGPAEGRLLVMVGGDSAAVDAARDVYGLFSREVIHVGALGTGVALKLARNTAGYIMMAATHEALALAHAAGIGPDLVRYVIETAGVFTQALLPIDNGGPRPIGADADPALRSHLERTNSIGQKDLHQALATAATLGVDLTVAKAVVAEFDRVTRLREGPGE